MRCDVKFSATLALLMGFVALVGLLIAPPLAAQSAPQSASQMARGAKMWAATCNRCHDIRSPAERTDRQWTTIVAHMRTRANLTEADAEAILVFLQSMNAPEGAPNRTADSEPTTHGGGSPADLAWQEILRYHALRRNHADRADAARPLHESLLRYLDSLADEHARGAELKRGEG